MAKRRQEAGCDVRFRKKAMHLVKRRLHSRTIIADGISKLGLHHLLQTRLTDAVGIDKWELKRMLG